MLGSRCQLARSFRLLSLDLPYGIPSVPWGLKVLESARGHTGKSRSLSGVVVAQAGPVLVVCPHGANLTGLCCSGLGALLIIHSGHLCDRPLHRHQLPDEEDKAFSTVRQWVNYNKRIKCNGNIEERLRKASRGDSIWARWWEDFTKMRKGQPRYQEMYKRHRAWTCAMERQPLLGEGVVWKGEEFVCSLPTNIYVIPAKLKALFWEVGAEDSSCSSILCILAGEREWREYMECHDDKCFGEHQTGWRGEGVCWVVREGVWRCCLSPA